MIWVLLILVLIVLFVVWGMSQYNGLVKARNQVQEAWHQIDVELKRRHDLIPNLLETVKAYAQHERQTLDDVINARNAAVRGGDNPEAAAQTEGQLDQALGRLMMVAESYPDLKSNTNFLGLQQELSATEDRIASGRRYYNAVVRDLNTKIESIPTKFFAGPAGVARAEYFETQGQERAVPKVDFGNNPAPQQQPQGYSMPQQQIEQQQAAPNPMPGQGQQAPQYQQQPQQAPGQQNPQQGGPQGYPGQ